MCSERRDQRGGGGGGGDLCSIINVCSVLDDTVSLIWCPDPRQETLSLFCTFHDPIFTFLPLKSKAAAEQPLTSAGLSVGAWWLGLRISLVLIAGWLFALGALRPELSWCPISERGVRRCGLAGGFGGSPSDDPVSAGPLSGSASSESRQLSGTAVFAAPLASSGPFSASEPEYTMFLIVNHYLIWSHLEDVYIFVIWRKDVLRLYHSPGASAPTTSATSSVSSS